MTTRQLRVEEILNGTGLGRMQSVGHMSVIPLVDEGDAQDDTFAPPDLTVNNDNYGNVDIRNDNTEKPTIVPIGAGWVTKQAAQDHAVPSAALIKKGQTEHIETAACIERSQGGFIKNAKNMLIIPAQMRAHALSTRRVKNYSKLWDSISSMCRDVNLPNASGHLNQFLNHYEKELDEFVAEFELVPKQLGAIVMIGDKVVGIERAPTEKFWQKIWTPLIRICYGALAIRAGIKGPPRHRVRFKTKSKTFDGIRKALAKVNEEAREITKDIADKVKKETLKVSDKADGALDDYRIVTVANKNFSGQVIGKTRAKTPYVSLCST